MRARHSTAVAVILLMQYLLAPVATAGVPSLGKSVWAIDLRKLDGSEAWLGASAYEVQRQIAFVSSDEIVVMRTSRSFPSPSQARAYSLEASSGRVMGQADWTAGTSGWLFATAEGRCVVNTVDGAIAYSSGLKEVLATSPHSIRWASPDGLVLAAWYVQKEPRHGVTEFLDPRTLEPIGVKFLDQSVESIAGDRIAYRASNENGHLVVVRGPQGQVGAFHTACDARPDFVNADVLVASGCDRFDVAQADGKLLFFGPSSENEWFAAAARDGRRFVLSRGSHSMSHWSSLRAESFTVFDLERKTAIARLKVPAAHGVLHADSHAGAALSPDGARLAILSGGVVRLYRLP